MLNMQQQQTINAVFDALPASAKAGRTKTTSPDAEGRVASVYIKVYGHLDGEQFRTIADLIATLDNDEVSAQIEPENFAIKFTFTV